jgi:hypothetical protein
MADYSNYLLQKAKMKHEAANAKPEKPRFGDEAIINNALFNMNKQMPNENEATVNLLTELQEGSKPGKVMSAGDAMLAGAKAGVQRKSFLDDKERLGKIMAFTEKTRQMVEDTNRELYKQEKLYNAKQELAPQWDFIFSSPKLTEAERLNGLNDLVRAFKNKTGLDIDVVNPNFRNGTATIFIDGEPQFGNLADIFKTPKELRTQAFLNSSEVQKADQMALQEHQREVRNQNAVASLHEAQAKEHQTKADYQQSLQERKRQMTESGRLPAGAILFDEVTDSTEKRARIEDLKAEKEKLQPTIAGIKALNEMDNILRKYPNLSTSLARWANSKEDGLAGYVLKNIVNKDERDALLQLEKHASTLALGTIQQFKGQRPTDILKKLIKDTNPGSNFTYEAFVPIKNQYIQQFEEQKAKSMEANNAWNNRYFPSYENVYNNIEQHNNPIAQIQSADPSLTPEMIAEAQRRLQNVGK